MSTNEDGFNVRPDDEDVADANDREWDEEPETPPASAGSWEEPHQRSSARPIPPDAAFTRESPPEEARPAEEEPTIAPGIMIGATMSGKTTLLLAIGRACHLIDDESLELEFVPDERTGELMKEATERITGKKRGPDATVGKPDNYPFWIRVSAKPKSFWEHPLDTDLYMVMSDGAGEYLLPAEDMDVASNQWRNELISIAQNATSIIFCIDVTAPSATILEKELPLLLSKITVPRTVDIEFTTQQRFQNWFHQRLNRVRRWFRRPLVPPLRTKRSKPCLSVERFLLLLTQVDKLCYKMDNPARYAGLIDPVEQARDLLGIPLLNSIRSALKPGAAFAVGVNSAWGFRPDGEPFADPDGTPINLADESGEDILKRWTPFGIRDAIYFIATGRCRGTVKQLTRKDLELARGLEPLPFSFRKTSEHIEV
jgi:hypothetical protein